MKIRQISEGVLNEAGLSRVLAHFNGENFAVLTAFRGGNTYQQNVQRNRALEQDLRNARAGGIKLIGHWAEAPVGIDFRDATPDQLTDVTEESYFVPQPSGMDDQAFKGFILSLIRKFEQDAAVFGDESGVNLISKDGSLMNIGSKISIGKLAQAYSTIGGRNFIFEGTMAPSSIAHRQVLQRRGVEWI